MQTQTFETDDRPSSARVERFLEEIEENRTAVNRRRWLSVGVGAAVGSVAVLTAFGLVPVAVEEIALAAGAVFAGSALSQR